MMAKAEVDQPKRNTLQTVYNLAKATVTFVFLSKFTSACSSFRGIPSNLSDTKNMPFNQHAEKFKEFTLVKDRLAEITYNIEQAGLNDLKPGSADKSKLIQDECRELVKVISACIDNKHYEPQKQFLVEFSKAVGIVLAEPYNSNNLNQNAETIQIFQSRVVDIVAAVRTGWMNQLYNDLNTLKPTATSDFALRSAVSTTEMATLTQISRDPLLKNLYQLQAAIQQPLKIINMAADIAARDDLAIQGVQVSNELLKELTKMAAQCSAAAHTALQVKEMGFLHRHLEGIKLMTDWLQNLAENPGLFEVKQTYKPSYANDILVTTIFALSRLDQVLDNDIKNLESKDMAKLPPYTTFALEERIWGISAEAKASKEAQIQEFKDSLHGGLDNIRYFNKQTSNNPSKINDGSNFKTNLTDTLTVIDSEIRKRMKQEQTNQAFRKNEFSEIQPDMQKVLDDIQRLKALVDEEQWWHPNPTVPGSAKPLGQLVMEDVCKGVEGLYGVLLKDLTVLRTMNEIVTSEGKKLYLSGNVGENKGSSLSRRAFLSNEIAA